MKKIGPNASSPARAGAGSGRAGLAEDSDVEMKMAQPTDWKTETLPSKQTTIALDRLFSREDMEVIQRGLIPEEMEDKWFIYWKDENLFFHRSWTGFCIYIVHFAVENQGARMVKADVNRDPEQYSETIDANDARMIDYLVDILLLQKESTFPSDEISPEKRAIKNWSQVGRAMFGKNQPGGLTIIKKPKSK